jgi:hypothetical protein
MPVVCNQAIDTYHDILKNTPGLIDSAREQLSRRMHEVRFDFGGRMLSPYLRPCFVERAHFDRISAVCQTIWNSVMKVGDLAINDTGMQDYLGLTDIERKLIGVDPKFHGVSRLARLDSFLTDSKYQFVELNAETPAGVAYADVASEIFDELMPMQLFKEKFRVSQLDGRRHLLGTLLAAYSEFCGSNDKRPHIAVVDYKGLPTQREFELCQEYFASKGYPTIIADPRELEFTNGRLRHGDFEIDLVYKRLLVNEFLEKFDECQEFYKAYKAQAVCVVNSFRGKLVHKKLLFGVLTDERFEHLFSNEERQLIQQHVPWTRRLESRKTTFNGQSIDLMEFARKNRDRLVLKPNDDYGGKGIFIGWQCDANQWDQAIESALDNDYLIQDRVTTSREIFPHVTDNQVAFSEQLVDLDPMLYDGKVGCAFARLSNTELANVTAGGGMVPVFIVEGTR